MKWQRTESHRHSFVVRGVFAARRTTRFAINLSCKRQVKICSPSSTQTEIALHITCADFTTWLWISVGSRGRFWQNAHGPKFAAKAKERSLRRNTQRLWF